MLSNAGKPEGAAGKLAVIQSCGAIHKRKPRGQRNMESPFICAAARCPDVAGPLRPPVCQFSRDGFDNENRESGTMSVEEFIAEAGIVFGFEFIDGECGNDSRFCRHMKCLEIDLSGRTLYSKMFVVPAA